MEWFKQVAHLFQEWCFYNIFFFPKASPMLAFSSSCICREMEVTRGWKIDWGEVRWEGTDGSDDWVDGEETVGNSIGESSVGRMEMKATRGEGARWKRRQGGRRGNRGK